MVAVFFERTSQTQLGEISKYAFKVGSLGTSSFFQPNLPLN
jgi:hypothetical protein